eukprot:scaffold1678_cov110-Isochrysis_galbana.AAC.15
MGERKGSVRTAGGQRSPAMSPLAPARMVDQFPGPAEAPPLCQLLQLGARSQELRGESESERERASQRHVLTPAQQFGDEIAIAVLRCET